jgi:YVTN family beta-propeller protein
MKLKLTSLCFLLLGLCMIYGEDRANTAVHPVLLVISQGDRDISFIDPFTNRTIAIVPEGQTVGHAHEIAVLPEGRIAYVPIYSDVGVGKAGADGREMLLIDIPHRKVIEHIDFGHGVRPHCPVYDPVNGLLYVTTELDNTVTVINPRTLKIVGTIPTGRQQSHMLAISHDGRRGYVANVGPGSVSVLDLRARTTLAIIQGLGQGQRISVSTNDTHVFVPDQAHPRLAIIDTSINAIKTWIPLPSIGFSTTPTRDGHWLLVTLKSANKLGIIDLNRQTVVRTIDLPAGPQEIVLRPESTLAYISCIRAGKVAVVDTSTWMVTALVDAGAGADGLAWAP